MSKGSLKFFANRETKDDDVKTTDLKTRLKDIIEQKGTGKVAWKMLRENTKGVSSRVSAVGHAEYDKLRLDVFPYYLEVSSWCGGGDTTYEIRAGKTDQGINTSTWSTDGMYSEDHNYYGFSDRDTLMKVFDRFKEEGFETSIDESLQDELIKEQLDEVDGVKVVSEEEIEKFADERKKDPGMDKLLMDRLREQIDERAKINERNEVLAECIKELRLHP